MRRTYKYRLYTNRYNAELVGQIHVAASIWNHSVALTRRYYQRYGRSIGSYRLMKHIARLRRRNAYWQRLGSQAVQDVIQRLYKAYDRFFKDPKRVGRPGFKKRVGYTSFTLKQAGWAYLGEGRIRIGSRVHRFVESRPVSGQIKTVTIKRDRAGRLWLCFSVLEAAEHPVPHEEVTHPVGLDFGLKMFLTFPDGSGLRSPRFFEHNIKAYRKAHRRLSSKNKGSINRRKARIKLAKVAVRTADQRRDWFFKRAHELCDHYDLIAVEDLNLRGMQQLWGRKVSDYGFGEFVLILEWVCLKRGVAFQKVGRFYASSKTCNACGVVNAGLRLSDRFWRCGCGASHDRDQNAAMNIRDRALSLWLGNRRPGLSPAVAA